MKRPLEMILAAVLILSWLPSVPWAQAETTSFTGVAAKDEEFTSLFLKGRILTCKGTLRPVPTDYVMLPLMAAHGEAFKGKTVLDIGTGTGLMALYAAQLGAARVIATDIDPLAIACAKKNARRLGLESIVETRLVALQDPLAFSVIRPEEIVDVIVSLPPNEAYRVPLASSGSIDDSIPPNDSIKLGLSIVDGLEKHLSRDGAAVLLYDSVVLHKIMVGYARHMGFAVEHHPAFEIHGTDWCSLYNTFAAKVARSERIDPGALLSSWSTCEEGAEHYVNADKERLAFPPLWGKDLAQAFPGVIVIRKQASSKSASGKGL